MSARSLIWLLIILIALADTLALPFLGMSLDWSGELRNTLLLPIFLTTCSFLRRWRQPQAARYLTALTQLLAFAHVGTIFTYALTAASPFPVADPLFERADIAVGFDWLSWFNWINHHFTAKFILSLAYNSMLPQIFILIAIFSYIDKTRVDEFVIASILAVVVIFPILYLLPTCGAFGAHGITGVSWETDILEMRSHTALIIQPREGIVTFPSYHAVLGVLFVNMARGYKRMFYPLLTLNALLLLSVMNNGGHYLVDMVSGIGVAGIAIGGSRFLLARCSREATVADSASVAPLPG